MMLLPQMLIVIIIVVGKTKIIIECLLYAWPVSHTFTHYKEPFPITCKESTFPRGNQQPEKVKLTHSTVKFKSSYLPNLHS